MADVTQLLREVRQGEDRAADALFALVYDELSALAKRQRARWNGNDTLNTTALVHEAYLKLAGGALDVDGRAHFFALASKAMRQVLSNYARDRRRQKRGGAQPHVALDDATALADPVAFTDDVADTFVALDEALARLEALSPRQSRVVECRFYGQLSVPETATALGLSPATVKRDWAAAQAWLHRELRRPPV
ncbi:MAG: ECF-type sigma factor [Bacteroidota bacterium]